ncbi:hypothetical protein AZF37_02825 [endosymbiont 'TC1' of Trimyema compressum]|uniref:leucine-rich repeat domain-containing protein n=1 Tax=endosymbiont 'TC1' of Trimyema compressum TaxID=243899 RepID=UPI0007F0B9E9|nr:leucine-rich repeat domain-containing protein [endosymbiont 'TC1' of Trimyema compressum]AMP20248.1 hypothetical protein AZF37_02825 [endosymbiont 'TC1' of Trimyema compressum]
MANLEYLSLEYSKFSSLPNSIGNLEKLKSLNLANNENLISLPEFNGSYPDLIYLNARECALTALPNSFANLTKLQSLQLNGNQLSVLPDGLSNFTDLYYLQVNDNKLTQLPSNIGNLVNLTELSLENNQLSSLPDSYGNLVNLYNLNLSDNQITELPSSLANTNIQTVTLDRNNLINFPAGLEYMESVSYLALNENHLFSIPDTIENMSSLTAINLSHNDFTEIPNALTKLTSLNSIILDFNNITEIPVVYNSDNMPNLYHLSLEENKIQRLPDFASSTINYYFNLSGNALVERIPENIRTISTQNQKVTMDINAYIKVNEDDLLDFELYDVLPEIIKQFEEIKGQFNEYEVTWTVVKPNLEEVFISGGDKEH